MIKLLLILTLVLMPIVSHAAVLFEDNFNAQADWQPSPGTNDASPSGASVDCDYTTADCSASPPPTNWDFFRTTGLWWAPTYQDTIRITNEAGRGGSGKAFIVYNESNVGASGDGWGADGILAKLLSSDQQELYVRYYLRTQTSWTWEMNQRVAIKTFRVGHFDRSGTNWTLGSSGNKAPLMIYDLMNSTDAVGQLWGSEQSASFRCDPQATDYYCGGSPIIGVVTKYYKTDYPSGVQYVNADDPATTGLWADTSWHSYLFHMKMNTNAGGSTWNADGVYEFTYDGIVQYSATNVKWIDSGADTGIGWNTVELGGNALNSYTAVANFGEQWYAIDDIVISTTVIPVDYVIGSGTPVNGACGSQSGGSATALTSSSNNLCTTGTVATFLSGQTPNEWTWGCDGSSGGTNTASDACVASLTATPMTARCNGYINGSLQ